uniref:Uncharacterized protein n=1 Tax=Panagrolaimus sp. JU765 TaxID=591449 RepID=A0AC34RLA6_9BILA
MVMNFLQIVNEIRRPLAVPTYGLLMESKSFGAIIGPWLGRLFGKNAFVREFVSNACDALEKRKRNGLVLNDELYVNIVINKEERTLTIR